MPFIAKNPINSVALNSVPATPIPGTRSIFPMNDGWYEMDSDGNVRRLGADNIETITLTTITNNTITTSNELGDLRDRKIYKLEVEAGYRTGWLIVSDVDDFNKNICQTLIDLDGSIYNRYHSEVGGGEEGWSDWNKYISTENIDTALSDTSTNPIQNKVIKQAIDLKAEQLELERLKYYGDKDIIPSDESYFTVNETSETITGLTEAGKTQTELVIPYEINGKEITTLGDFDSILEGNSVITKVVIPNSVTTIGHNAFNSCSALTSINIPNSVTSIRDRAFQNCSSLTSITIPNSVTSIGDSVFNSCTSLTSITIPNSVTSIEDHAFSYCTSLTSINIPNSVTSIGWFTFRGCTSLTSISIPNSVTSIDDAAFEGCTNLTIYCEQGSYVETYAKENNIPVIYTDIVSSKYITKDTVESTYATKTSVIPKISLWQPNTSYEVGNVVLAIDPDGYAFIGTCKFNHNSLSYGTPFEGDDYDNWTFKNISSYYSNIANEARRDYNGNQIDTTYATKIELRPTPITSTATAITVNNSYNYGEQSELSITFPTTANDGDVVYITFTSGATATVLTLDTTNTSDIELIPEANTGYEIYAKYNGTVWIVNYSDYTVTAEAGV